MVALIRHALIAIAGIVTLQQLGCADCPDYGGDVPGYRIQVVDEASEVPICDATVLVNDQPARTSSINCTYAFDIPKSGDTAMVSVTREGYNMASEMVSTKYDVDHCGHTIEVKVVIALKKIQ
jgi:hypothetical protein